MAEMITVTKCRHCGKTFTISGNFCHACGKEEVETFTVRGTGRIYSYTTIRVPPARFMQKTPYIVGVVDLEDGMRIVGLIELSGEDDIGIGQPVDLLKIEDDMYIFSLSSPAAGGGG